MEIKARGNDAMGGNDDVFAILWLCRRVGGHMKYEAGGLMRWTHVGWVFPLFILVTCRKCGNSPISFGSFCKIREKKIQDVRHTKTDENTEIEIEPPRISE